MYHTLLVLDSLMKNCASDIHSEVLSVEFLGVVKGVITSSKVVVTDYCGTLLRLQIAEWS